VIVESYAELFATSLGLNVSSWISENVFGIIPGLLLCPSTMLSEVTLVMAHSLASRAITLWEWLKSLKQV